jgi:predicted signal transduction protein with EAL and GGDEF domain
MMAVRFKAEQENPARIAESVREWAEMPLDLPSGKLYLTASVGVAVYPDNASTAPDLVQCTDAALRRAKRLGRNAALSFAAGHMDEVRDRIAFRGRLRNAIINNEMVLHYQPQIRARDGYIVGMEALVRWSTTDHGLLSPARFIPLAEDLGVIVELGRWVLREACPHRGQRIGIAVASRVVPRRSLRGARRCQHSRHDARTRTHRIGVDGEHRSHA